MEKKGLKFYNNCNLLTFNIATKRQTCTHRRDMHTRDYLGLSDLKSIE